MKVNAHPLVVAVAMGLLGPGALVADDETTEADEGCTESSWGGRPCPPDVDARSATVATWQPGPAPSSEEFHRVELEWLKQG